MNPHSFRPAAVVALLLVQAVHAGDITPAMNRPAAARGGMLVLPLNGCGRTEWPDSIALQRTDGGRPIDGVIGWVASAVPSVERSWTRSDEQLDIRPIARAPSGAPPEQTGTVVLMANMPIDVSGPLQLGSGTVDPAWLELVDPLPFVDRPQLHISANAQQEQPDPIAPSEWFRWWLLAEAAGLQPPAPTGDEVSQRFALHRGQLWRAGLDRVERVSPGVANELRERLTAVCSETQGKLEVRIAAWIAKSDDLSALLSLLVDRSRSEEQVMDGALTWLRAQPPLMCWVEGDDGSSVRVVAANPTSEEAIVMLSWMESPAMPPLAMRVPAHGIGRQTMERPPELMPDLITRSASPISGTLLLQWKEWKRRLPVGAGLVTPRPPGLGVGLLLPSLSLADAQRGRVTAPPQEWRSTASLRRRFGVWEIFAECLRPRETELDELEVLVGETSRGIARIRVREQGEPIVEGLGELPKPTIHRSTFADRWRCVIELPAEWCERADANSASREPGMSSVLLLGVARSPGGSGTRQCAGLSVPPFTPIPLLALDPSGWWSATQAAPPQDKTADTSVPPVR